MKIAFFGISEEEKKDYFLQNLTECEVTFFKEPLSENTLPEERNFEIVSVFVNCPITASVINSFPNLKFIAARSTGFDNIDIAFAQSKNILVANVPAYGSHTVAEFTFSLILNLTRKTYLGINRLKASCDFSFEGLRGFDLSGKTLGVVGTGKIGSNVITIAKGFNMQVLGFDTFPNEQLAKTLDFTYTSLEELLKKSDIVSLHVPYMKETHHLINKNTISLMKKGSLLINTARGAVVETEALFQALTSGHLLGAALDVLEEEEKLKEEAELLSKKNLDLSKMKNVLEEHILVHLPSVIITPHMAFYTKEAELAIMETTINNIKSFLAGNPENLVNPQPPKVEANTTTASSYQSTA